jgi:hypothetical protein
MLIAGSSWLAIFSTDCVQNVLETANVRFGSMLLKKSQIARRQFSCCKKSDRRPPNRCGLNRVTEVASEFHLQAMRSPTFLHENRVYSQKKF